MFNVCDDGSTSITKQNISSLVDAIPKTTKGNHPVVKKAAKKAVKKTTKAIAKETGETVANKTFSGFIKNFFKVIF